MAIPFSQSEKSRRDGPLRRVCPPERSPPRGGRSGGAPNGRMGVLFGGHPAVRSLQVRPYVLAYFEYIPRGGAQAFFWHARERFLTRDATSRRAIRRRKVCGFLGGIGQPGRSNARWQVALTPKPILNIFHGCLGMDPSLKIAQIESSQAFFWHASCPRANSTTDAVWLWRHPNAVLPYSR